MRWWNGFLLGYLVFAGTSVELKDSQLAALRRSAVSGWRKEQSTLLKPPIANYQDSSCNIVMETLRSRVYDVIKETPLSKAPNLSKKLGNQVLIKREDLNPIFSFKIRGAYNKMRQLSKSETDNGVVCCSAGNHAQGVAFSAHSMGVSAKIFMPGTTPEIKVNAVKSYGGGVKVFLVGSTYNDAYEAMMLCAKADNRTIIHPFDDPKVIAGQGTIGLEILKQTTEEPLDGIFMAVGGGGLISGVGAFIKAVAPHIKVIGVEAVDAAAMTVSLQSNKPISLSSVGLFADGAAVKTPGNRTFAACQQFVDEMVTVTTDEICGAIKDAFSDIRVVLEPAGALGIAGLNKYVQQNKISGKRFAVIASGANVDFTRLRFVAERADSRESLVSVVIPEKPGEFNRLAGVIYPRAITGFSYRLTSTAAVTNITFAPRRRVSPNAHIMLSYRPCDASDAKAVEKRLTSMGYTLMNLDSNELAKTHVRYMAVGRSTDVKDELLYNFMFPEVPGAMKRFLDALTFKFNISMFHYRNAGGDVGSVLVGIQVPQQHRKVFKEYLAGLKEAGFTWRDESANPLYRQFLSISNKKSWLHMR